MTEKEKNEKIDELWRQWEEEIKNIPDVNNQPKDGVMLDNGDSGEYKRITEKYRKLIDKIKNS